MIRLTRWLLLGALLLAGAAQAAPFQGQVFEGKLKKSVVQAVFARGPQPFVASLRVKAAFDGGGRFAGFRVLFIKRHSPIFGNASVGPGDVITQVNGLPIERPEHFMAAWEKARGADTLEIDVLRGDTPVRYRWTLVP